MKISLKFEKNGKEEKIVDNAKRPILSTDNLHDLSNLSPELLHRAISIFNLISRNYYLMRNKKINKEFWTGRFQETIKERGEKEEKNISCFKKILEQMVEQLVK